jgi:hypothetical protein
VDRIWVLQASACEVALENGATRVPQRQSRNNSSHLCCPSTFRGYAVDIEALAGKVVCHVFRKLLILKREDATSRVRNKTQAYMSWNKVHVKLTFLPVNGLQSNI